MARMGLKEEEIRPEHIFAEYLRLAQQDAREYFDTAGRQVVRCPACDTVGTPAFTKHTFEYSVCPACQTLFVSGRPPASAFSRYYRESASVKYWASTFYKETAEARREKLWRPKALMIRDLVQRFATGDHGVVDVGGGYGIFAEEFAKVSGKSVTVIEPGPALAEVCRAKGLTVIEAFLEDISSSQLDDQPRAFVSFELFEHLHNPGVFLRSLCGLMRRGDLFIFTTLSGTGVDIQALWEDSKSVSPPHHLNFFNPASARILLNRVGLEVLEASTPGQLDIEILCKDPALVKDRFWRTFCLQATDKERQVMQKSLVECGRSSHLLVVCRKPD